MKWIKRLGLLLVALLVLLVVAVVVIMAVFDPNDYKAEIEAEAEAQTGRKVTLAGDIGWSFYPALGIDVEKMTVANADGFGDEPQLSANELSLYVQLLPLLSGDIEVKGVALDGLVLRITRDASGKTNYDDLIERFTGDDAPAEEDEGSASEGSDSAISISSIALTNTQIIYDDQQAGERYELAELNVLVPEGVSIDTVNNVYAVPEWEVGLFDNLQITGSLNSESNGDVTQLAGAVNLAEVDIPELMASIMGTDNVPADSPTLPTSAEGVIQFDAILRQPSEGQALPVNITFADTDFVVDWQGETLQLEAPNLTFDSTDETLTGDAMRLTGAGLDVTAKLSAAQLLSDYVVQADINVAEFSPSDMLSKLQIALPDMADKDALQQASLVATAKLTPNSAALSDMTLMIDDTTVEGSLSITDLAALAVQGQLAIDRIDIDRYLPEGEAEASNGDDDSSTHDDVNQIEIPVQMLRDLQAQLALSIDWLKAADMQFTKINTQLSANAGLVLLQPLQFDAYQGQFDGYARIDARQDEPTYSIESNLNNVAAADAQQDILAKTYVSGIASLQGELSTRGKTVGDMRQNLNGNVRPKFANGAVLGVNVVKYLRQVSVLLEGGSIQDTLMAAATAEDAQTDFSLLTVGCLITNGVANCDDLTGEMPGLRLGGLGKIDLFNETMDYTVKLSVVDSLQGQGGVDLSELKGITIPVRCKGSWADPSCKPALEDILKAKLKAELEEQYEEKLQDKVEDKLEEKLGEEGKEFLKGLFGR